MEWAHCIVCMMLSVVHRNSNLQTSKAPLKNQAQGTSLFTSFASNQRGWPVGGLGPVARGFKRGGKVAVKAGVV